MKTEDTRMMDAEKSSTREAFGRKRKKMRLDKDDRRKDGMLPRHMAEADHTRIGASPVIMVMFGDRPPKKRK